MKIKIVADHVGKIFPVRCKNADGGWRTSEFVALDNVRLEVEEGQFLALVGPSGCGKSTFLDILAGLVTPTSGKVLIGGRPVNGPGLDRGVVFQTYALFPWRTALGNVEFGLEAKGIAKQQRTEIARHFLALVELSAFEDRYPHELSGGMRQRVAIARSLAYDPDVLLMDEPFGALDAQTRESLQYELVKIWQKTKKTIVFVTHSIDEAVLLGQKVAVMSARPGAIKHLLDVSLPDRENEATDVQSSAQFVAIRHQIWDLLRAETTKTSQIAQPDQTNCVPEPELEPAVPQEGLPQQPVKRGLVADTASRN